MTEATKKTKKERVIRSEGDRAWDRYEVLVRKLERVHARKVKIQADLDLTSKEENELQAQVDWMASNPAVEERLAEQMARPVKDSPQA